MHSLTADSQKESTVIFMHIPKAAGVTLHRIIERQYRPTAIFTIRGKRVQESVDQFRRFSEAKRRKFRVIKGHMGFGLHNLLPQQSDYITMLRDPVDRIVSHYYYVLQSGPRHYLYNTVTAQRMSLEDYVRSGITPELNNGQTRLLSGIEDIGVISNFDQCSIGFQDFPDGILDQAKNNLQQHFAVVGIANRFDESLLLFKKALGWRNISYTQKNTTRNRPHKEDIPKETISLIEKYNELDIELFDYARKLFEGLIEQQPPSFYRELEEFRSLKKRRSLSKRSGRMYTLSISSSAHQVVRAAYTISAMARNRFFHNQRSDDE